MNILFVNYGDFSTNSLNHIAEFANYLTVLGHQCIVAVPQNRKSYRLLNKVIFKPATFLEVLSLESHFPNRKPADIIHAWTPRINVASFVSQYQAAYGSKQKIVVHMEDNEVALMESFYGRSYDELLTHQEPINSFNWEPMLSHPLQHKAFLEYSDANTTIISSLFELTPHYKPQLILPPGIDFADLKTPDVFIEQTRKKYNLKKDQEYIIYSGGVSSSNLQDIATLYDAVHLIRERGHPVKLIKTGPSSHALSSACRYYHKDYVIDLGFIPKPEVNDLLKIATALIQPGNDDDFNRYRLPSKLPEFLASGTPVIVGKTNLGRSLSHRLNAYILDAVTPESIANSYIELKESKILYRKIGENGKHYAQTRFDLQKNGDSLLEFYQSLIQVSPIYRKRKAFNEQPIINYNAIEKSKNNNRGSIWVARLLNRTVNIQPNNGYLIKVDYSKPTTPEDRHEPTAGIDHHQLEENQIPSPTLEPPLNHEGYSLKLSLVLPTYNPNLKLLQQAINSVVNQNFLNWELCIADDCSSSKETIGFIQKLAKSNKKIKVIFRDTNGHISKATNSALALATGHYIGFMDQDDVLATGALQTISNVILANRGAAILYTNEDKLDFSGERVSPYLKPKWNSEFFNCQNFIGHLCFIENKLLKRVGSFDPNLSGSQDWDILMRASRLCDPRAIVHIPHTLYHWRMTRNSTASSIGNKRYAFKASKTALKRHLSRTGHRAKVINHKNIYIYPEYQKLRNAIITIIPEFSNTDASIEQLKVDCHSNIETMAYPDSSIPKMSIGARRNYAIKNSKTEYLCIIRSGLQPATVKWLEQLAAYLSRIEVAMVAPKVINSDNLVHSCGLAVLQKRTVHAEFEGIPEDSDGYYHQALLPRAVDGVSSECILFRKSAWGEVGGFCVEENLLDKIDLDFSQKLIQSGYQILVCPQVKVHATVPMKQLPTFSRIHKQT